MRWILGLGIALISSCLPAATISFTSSGTASSTTGSNGPVNARVDFVITNGHIDVKIYNLQTGITKDIQTISGINFTLSEVITTANIATRAGLERYVCGKNDTTPGCTGSGTYFDLDTDNTFTHWTLVKDTAPATILNGLANAWDLSAFDGGNPTHTIIGAPDPLTNLYKTGNQFPNNSITNHEPLLASSAILPVIFGINMPTLTANATITELKIFYGTDRTAPCPGPGCTVVPAVPEPGTLGLAGAAMLGVLQFRRKRPKQTLRPTACRGR